MSDKISFFNKLITSNKNMECNKSCFRFGVNELGMSRAAILESGVVIRCESFELQPFKVDQHFRGVFKRSSNKNTYRNEAFKDIFN